jgi:hypothetical protein
MPLSRKARTALKAYGHETCVQAFFRNELDGEGASTVGFYHGLTTRQADAAIDAGREFLLNEHRIEVECLTCSVHFSQYVRAVRPSYGA